MFVIGLSPRLADPEVLKKNEYFGKYGKIYKVVINNTTVYNGAQVRGCGLESDDVINIINDKGVPLSGLASSPVSCTCMFDL